MARPSGQPKLGGRRKGTPNKVTAAIRELAAPYSADALNVIVQLMHTAKNEATRLAAAREILDRAHGKPRQAVEIDGLAQAYEGYPTMPDDPVEASRVYLSLLDACR